MASKQTARFAVLNNSIHALPSGAKAVRRTPGQRWLELTLGVRRAKPVPSLAGLDMQKPSSRTYLTRKQLATDFGSDPKAVEAITAYAKAHHLVVTRDERASARLGVAGTAADLSAVFNVTLFDYSHPTLGDFHARTGPVHVPQELEGAVTGVFGFNNHRILQRKLHSSPKPADLSVKARSWFVPTELAPLYGFPTDSAATQCIGLLEFGGGVETADVAAYFQKIGQPAPGVTVVAWTACPRFRALIRNRPAR